MFAMGIVVSFMVFAVLLASGLLYVVARGSADAPMKERSLHIGVKATSRTSTTNVLAPAPEQACSGEKEPASLDDKALAEISPIDTLDDPAVVGRTTSGIQLAS